MLVKEKRLRVPPYSGFSAGATVWPGTTGGDEIVEAIVFVSVVVWIDDEHDARKRTAETRQTRGGHIVFSFIFLPPWSQALVERVGLEDVIIPPHTNIRKLGNKVWWLMWRQRFSRPNFSSLRWHSDWCLGPALFNVFRPS